MIDTQSLALKLTLIFLSFKGADNSWLHGATMDNFQGPIKGSLQEMNRIAWNSKQPILNGWKSIGRFQIITWKIDVSPNIHLNLVVWGSRCCRWFLEMFISSTRLLWKEPEPAKLTVTEEVTAWAMGKPSILAYYFDLFWKDANVLWKFVSGFWNLFFLVVKSPRCRVFWRYSLCDWIAHPFTLAASCWNSQRILLRPGKKYFPFCHTCGLEGRVNFIYLSKSDVKRWSHELRWVGWCQIPPWVLSISPHEN